MFHISNINTLIEKSPIFCFFAFAGTGLWLVQILFSGLGTAHDIDSEPIEDLLHFKWLSKQALTGFFMMFGWVGITCRQQFNLSFIPSLMIGLGGGLIAIVGASSLLHIMRKLRSTGTVFRIEDTVGKEATVYLRIPQGGVGKVSISLNHFTYEIDALSNDPTCLESFTPVHIVKKVDEKTVIVTSKK